MTPLRRRLARWLFLAGFGLLAALGTAEVAVRVYELSEPEEAARLAELEDPERGFPFDGYSGHPFLPFVGAPNFDSRTFALTTEGLVEIHAVNNSYGFRAHELPATKGPDDYFVICLGESTTWGAADESNATTWPELLEARLAEKYPHKNFRVFNFGVSTATSVYSIVSLALIGIHIRPDLVIVYHGRNDPIPSGAPDYRTDHAHFFKDFDPPTAWRGYRRSLPAWLLRSHAFLFVTARLDDRLGVNGLYHHVTHPHDHYRFTVTENAADKLTANLRTIHSIATGHGADVLFSTFQLYDPSVVQFPINDALRAFYAAEGYAYVDQDALLPDFDRSTVYDDCHFTREGRDRMAANFLDAIVANGFVK